MPQITAIWRLAVGLCALGLFHARIFAVPVTVTRLDGTMLAGQLREIDDVAVVIDTAEGNERLPLDDVAAIEAVDCPAAPPQIADAWFALSSGGALRGELVDRGTESVVARTALAERTVLPFASLAAVRLSSDRGNQAAVLFTDALASRQAGSDVLVALDDSGAKALRGRLVSLGPEEGTFVFGDRPRQFRTAKVYGVVFATGAASAAHASSTLMLATGDALSFRRIRSQGELLLVDAVFGQSFEVPLAQVCGLELANERVIYLSELPSERESSTGIIHPTWPIVRDANVLHEPLSIAGERFAHGIGMHARGELVYRLDGQYNVFAATIGIDDAVRPGGSVEFFVRGDGEELYASGPVTGADPPQTVRVPVEGVGELVLVVEPGANADVGDWADWGDARVILPQGAVTTLSQTARD